MKKLAIGCLVVVVIVLVVGGILGYIFVWRPASGYIASLRQLGEVSEIDKQVVNRSPFAPPAGNELTPEMVTRFAAVQEAMQQALGPRFAEMKTKYDYLDRLQKEEHRQPSFAEAMGAMKDLVGVFVLAKRAQVDALNKTRFSLDEYSWVRSRVYNAAGLPFSQLDFTRIADAAKRGRTDFQVEKAGLDEPIPERNKELVKPYLERLQREWVSLAFFGL